MTKKSLNQELVLVTSEPVRDENGHLAYHLGFSIYVEEDEYKELIRRVQNGVIEAKL